MLDKQNQDFVTVFGGKLKNSFPELKNRANMRFIRKMLEIADRQMALVVGGKAGRRESALQSESDSCIFGTG